MENTGHLELMAILKTLKIQLKVRGYTYADLANQLDISEVTVKRLLSGKNLSLKLILSICDFLNISFLDIASLAKEINSSQTYVLTKEQDLFFSNNPSYYFIFINLYRRVSLAKVFSDWDFDERRFFKLLRDYEKIGLIELYPKNVFKFKMTGVIQVPRGKLRKILQKYDQTFLQYMHNLDSSNDDRMLFQSAEVLLSGQHIEEIKNLMKETMKKIKEYAYIDETMLAKNKTESVRFLLAFSPYESQWK